MNLIETLKKSKLIPIAVFNDVDNALKTAEILVKNSFYLLEITLRTEAAFKCIKEISYTFPELLLGSGSVLSKADLEKAVDLGAKFGVAPGFDMGLVDFAVNSNIAFIPGIATPTELNSVLQAELKLIKIFPIVTLGGTNYIKAITAPFKIKDFYLIPTGGVKESNIAEYMEIDRVIACGASYIVDSNLIEKGDFIELEKRLQRTKKLLFI